MTFQLESVELISSHPEKQTYNITLSLQFLVIFDFLLLA